MRAKSPTLVIGVVLGFLGVQGLGLSESPGILFGSIAGLVTDSSGVPQMGANVLLFNRNDRLLQRVLTNQSGAFIFDALTPDSYSVKVNLSSFLPAMKQNIIVQAGMKSLLSVNLASVFSSIELIYTSPAQHSLMSDDWRWILRTASSTRPVLRFGQGVGLSGSPERREVSNIFSDTRGVIKVSAGDSSGTSLYGNEADLGTAFALATSIYSHNTVQFSGNFGYSPASGLPSAGFRTSYSRDLPTGTSPEVSVTMRQMFAPFRAGMAFLQGQGSGPMLRTMSASFADKARITDSIFLQYGTSLESVSFLDRMNYFSPYAKVTYDLGRPGTFYMAYASGLPPVDLLSSTYDGPDLQSELTAVGLFPRISVLDSRPRIQRARGYEMGYHKAFGSRSYDVSVYRDVVSNAAVTMLAPDGAFSESGDILPDLFSNSSVLNGGNYHSIGYMTSFTQHFGDDLSLGAAYSNGGVLVAGQRTLESDSADELRGALHQSRRHLVSARVSGTSHVTGTRYMADYGWSDLDALTPGHLFLTQQYRSNAGLNLYIRQPIPLFGGLPGRLELTADLRNLIAQGYVPITLPDGRRVVLMQTPRAIRGGVSFIF